MGGRRDEGMEFPGRRLRVAQVLTHPAGHFQRQDSFHNIINPAKYQGNETSIGRGSHVFFYESLCVCAYIDYIHGHTGACAGQKRVMALWNSELKVILSCLVWEQNCVLWMSSNTRNY